MVGGFLPRMNGRLVSIRPSSGKVCFVGVTATVPTSAPAFTLSVGSSLDGDRSKESFAVSDVEVHEWAIPPRAARRAKGRRGIPALNAPTVQYVLGGSATSGALGGGQFALIDSSTEKPIWADLLTEFYDDANGQGGVKVGG